MIRYSKRMVVLTFLIILLLVILDKLFPFPFPEKQGEQFAQVVTDRNGEPLRAFADKNGVWRYFVDNKDVSDNYKEALIQYEDRWFYQHQGSNPFSLLRACFQWIWNGRVISGGSTLTMQVARLFSPNKRTVSGKIQQLFRAHQLEWYLDKEEILNLYFNYAPFGGPVEGVQAASFVFLGKSADQLSDAEAALLTVLPQSPSRLRPYRYPEKARTARDKVLYRLLANNIWSVDRIQEALDEPILAQYSSQPQVAPLLSRRLKQANPLQPVIQSTIDINLQLAVENILKQYTLLLPDGISAAVLINDNVDMSAIVYAGSADFHNNKRYGHVDMIKATRSPGSTLKPFLYGMAIDDGLIHSESILFDVPMEYKGYHPENFHQQFSGPVSTRQALQRSLNLPAVQVLNEVGPESFYVRLANAGLKLKIPKDSKPNMAIILGGAGTQMETLVGTFSSLSQKGIAGKVRYMKQEQGESKRLLSEESAWIINNILGQVSMIPYRLKQVTEHTEHAWAWKTGTSYGYRDAWVLATNTSYSIGVWLGRPDGSVSAENYGRRMAVPLLKRIIALLPDSAKSSPPKPQRVTRSKICWPLGTLQHIQKKQWCHKILNPWLVDNLTPPTLKDPYSKDYSSHLIGVYANKAGKRINSQCNQITGNYQQLAVWPLAVEPWLPFRWRRQSLLPEYDEQCQFFDQDDKKLTFEGVDMDSKLFALLGEDRIPPVQLSVSGGSGKINWFHNKKWIAETEQKHLVEIEVNNSNKHQVHVIDSSGKTAFINFQSEINNLTPTRLR